MPDLYIFKAKRGMADPVALQDHNVAIHFVQAIYYRRVDFLEGIPEFDCVNLGGLAAHTQSVRTNLVNLEMADNEFGVFRWYPLDYAQFFLFHPAGMARGQLRNIQTPVEPAILFNDPNLVSTEIAVWQNNRPAMQAVNGLATAIGGTRVNAIGYRFHTIDPMPITKQEKALVAKIKGDTDYAAVIKNLDDGGILQVALKEGLLPLTHIWASGRGIGD